jgi:hypothetical protein
MRSATGWWLDYEYLRLTVEPHEDHWQTFVYDRKARLILYRAQRMTAQGAKAAAIEFALVNLAGPEHGPAPEHIAENLVWKPIGKPATQ